MILATHPFAKRQLNVLDEQGREGCARCGRPRGAHSPVDADLLDLAHVRLAELADEPTSTLDAVMRRLFDPRERDLLTVSAFSSAL